MPSTPPQADSPFMAIPRARFGFRTIFLVQLMIVAAGLGLLLFYAMRVPAITSELNAWFGRPNPPSDTTDARQAQLTFLLIVYAAPLGMGLLVYLMHTAFSWLDERTRPEESGDDVFRME